MFATRGAEGHEQTKQNKIKTRVYFVLVVIVLLVILLLQVVDLAPSTHWYLGLEEHLGKCLKQEGNIIYICALLIFPSSIVCGNMTMYLQYEGCKFKVFFLMTDLNHLLRLTAQFLRKFTNDRRCKFKSLW